MLTKKLTHAPTLRFGLIGMIATAVHAGVGYYAVLHFDVSGLQGNIIGYLLACWVSFFGHHVDHLGNKTQRLDALMRFLPNSLGMFMISLSVTGVGSVLNPSIPQEALPLMGAAIVPLPSLISRSVEALRQ